MCTRGAHFSTCLLQKVRKTQRFSDFLLHIFVDMMFENGAISEVIKFNKLKVKKQNSSNKVIGISEIGKYLNGELNLEETKQRICIKTRQYAKRQTTWARGQMKSWYKIDPNDLDFVIKKFK